MSRSSVALALLFFSVFLIAAGPALAQKELGHEPMHISAGAEAIDLALKVTDLPALVGSPTKGAFAPTGFVPGVSFLAYNFDDNATQNGGYVFIPPDPIGAAGPDRVIAVVNCGIECRNKTGTLIFRSGLQSMFSSVSTMGTATFDPKVVYDHYENRFVVVTLERWFTANGDPSDASRILLAVSKTSSPATATTADWWMFEIDSKINIGGYDHWADYPGFEVDEEAVYITNNMFPFTSGGGGVRLWIVDKGVVGGFYAGSTPSWNVYNPIPSGYYDLTTMPALVYGAGGAGTNIGTYLVGYSGLSYGGPGGNEVVQIIRVDNPLTAPTFTGQIVNVGDLEDVGGSFGWPGIADAPQLGSTVTIEVNDSRILDAVWRNNDLWVTTTIDPNTAYDATNTGQATAHWFRFNTTTPATITVADQGNIGGEDIATGTWTFFPAVAVNGSYDMCVGFAASASTIYCGAYFADRAYTDVAGTIGPSQTVKAGLDWYKRDFGGTRNRWGDYSGAAVDPADDYTFWIFNEYAETRGTVISGEDGRWGTAWASAVASQQGLDWGDAPDPTYPTLAASFGANHVVFPAVYMGALIDTEPNGIPHPTALGDDLTSLADEDGVGWPVFMGPGGTYQMTVTASVPGWVDAWIDFNQDGTWVLTEQIYSGPVTAGVNNLPFTVPVGSFIGQTFARVRFNTIGPVLPTGQAADGEVEDYAVVIEEQVEVDWGDAPDQPYPTLAASTGANHTIVQGIFLGAMIDAEPDGLPDPNAMGDDNSNQPDEDGVAWVTPLAPGSAAQVDVIPSVPGWVDAWVDFNFNGVWEASELIYSGAVTPPMTPIPFNVPLTAVTGFTFARVRFNTMGPLPVTGGAVDGEVEDYEVWIDEPVELDWGDAPDQPYPTLAASTGANHNIVPGVFMGNLIDAEPDGQPDPNAMGDDNNNQPDEDGVTWVTPLVPGMLLAQFDVVVSVAGWVDAWIDFAGDGVWGAGDLIYSGPVNPGLNNLGFAVPAGIGPGQTFARVRFNTGSALPVTGGAQDGEVEDYEVFIEEPQTLDWGDAPDPTYQTLASSTGPNHVIVPGVLMGAQIDGEPDGQPNANATGDDIANLPDEDGVNVVTPPAPGVPCQIDVFVSVAGWVDLWIDFDLDGTFTGADLMYSGSVVPGNNPLFFGTPLTAQPGAQTFMRVRYNTGGPLPPTGAAQDGEVEDYEIGIEEATGIDYGDAPDPTYPTLLLSDGARHALVGGVYMGAQVDSEPNGQPNLTATGDDIANSADEDGVIWVTPLTPTLVAQVDVSVTMAGWLDAWIDFDQNGIWDPTDQIYSGAVVAGNNPLLIPVPGNAVVGQTYARFRYNLGGALLVTGYAADGEVEDYQIDIDELIETDWGDAPDPTYPTWAASGGANHVIVPGVFMGALIDAELNGQPSPSATGDDVNNLADEDGVVWTTQLVPANAAIVTVTASVPGWVDVWIDFGQDGSWSGPDLAYSGAVNTGPNPLGITVPANAIPGQTFARVRYNTVGALPVTGGASDGEVEDYEVVIDEPGALDFGDAPDPSYPTLRTNDGARHNPVAGVFMGTYLDVETDGYQDPNARGDDLNNPIDDEDGLVWITSMVPDSTAQVNVTVSVSGWLDMWVDFNRNGSWTDTGEHVHSAAAGAGVNAITFTVPTAAIIDNTFARVRYNTVGALGVTGYATDGEVEDYEVWVHKRVTGVPDELGQRFGLRLGSPNPFNSRFTIQFATPADGTVELKVYNMQGQLVRTLVDGFLPEGQHTAHWDGRGDRTGALPAGIYFYRLRAGQQTETHKVIYTK